MYVAEGARPRIRHLNMASDGEGPPQSMIVPRYGFSRSSSWYIAWRTHKRNANAHTHPIASDILALCLPLCLHAITHFITIAVDVVVRVVRITGLKTCAAEAHQIDTKETKIPRCNVNFQFQKTSATSSQQPANNETIPVKHALQTQN